MNLNIEQVTHSLSKGGPIFKMLNLIMTKYDLDYKGEITYDKFKKVSNDLNEFSVNRLKRELGIKELITIKSWGSIGLYKREQSFNGRIRDYYWRVYNFIDNKLDEIDIDLNTIPKIKLRNQLIKNINEFQQDYQDCRNKLINHFQILDNRDTREICNTSIDNRKLHWKCELFEIEGKIQSLQYIIDNFLSPERSGPKKKN